KVFWIRAKEVPGWVPEFMEESDDESIFEDEMPDMEGVCQRIMFLASLVIQTP
nr:glucose-methanol-choline oxidoreductase, FAD/NAD(P)-binding domain protein [Tanacetum cinerariifolium]